MHIKLLFVVFLTPFVILAQEHKEVNKLKHSDAVHISHRKNSDKSIDFLYTKNKPGFYTVEYSFANMRNTNFSDGVKKVVLKHDKGTLFKIRPSDPKKGVSYKSNYRVIRGFVDPKIQDDYPYLFPVKENESIKIKELQNAEEKYLDKEKPLSWKSYGILKKTPKVYAARKGIVVSVTSKYHKKASNVKSTSKKNKVIVEHKDGTFATYKGFAPEGVAVKIGQEVYPQTVLGVLEQQDGEKKDYKLIFNLSYRATGLDKIVKEYITPKFFTEFGLINVEDGKEYIAKSDEDIFFKDFTKREKKQYLKANKK